MRPLQKWAVYNLIVLASGFLLYLALLYLINSNIARGVAVPLTGGSLGGGALLLRRKRKEKYPDERDRDIERNASLTGLWIFFLYYVTAGIYIMFTSGENPIDSATFETFWWWGALLLIVVMSLAVLVIYGWEEERRSGVLDFFHDMGDLQRGAILSFIAWSAILGIFLIIFPVQPESIVDWAQSIFYLLIAVFLFLNVSANMSAAEQDEQDTKIIVSARKVRWHGLAAAFLIGLAYIVIVHGSKGANAINPVLFLLAGYCAFGVGSLAFLAAVIVKARGQ